MMSQTQKKSNLDEGALESRLKSIENSPMKPNFTSDKYLVKREPSKTTIKTEKKPTLRRNFKQRVRSPEEMTSYMDLAAALNKSISDKRSAHLGTSLQVTHG